MRRFIAIATLLLASASCGSISPRANDGGAGGATGSGGNPGSGGQGSGPSCEQIQAQYQAALTVARECSIDAANQCQQTAPDALGCNGCTTFVNDSSGLSQFANQWNQAGCNQNQLCTKLACLAPKSATCQTSDAGGGARCVDALVSTTGP